MKNKKKNNTVDDIDFVGTQEKISDAEWRRIHKETGKFIEAYKNASKSLSSIRSKVKRAS